MSISKVKKGDTWSPCILIFYFEIIVHKSKLIFPFEVYHHSTDFGVRSVSLCTLEHIGDWKDCRIWTILQSWLSQLITVGNCNCTLWNCIKNWVRKAEIIAITIMTTKKITQKMHIVLLSWLSAWIRNNLNKLFYHVGGTGRLKVIDWLASLSWITGLGFCT